MRDNCATVIQLCFVMYKRVEMHVIQYPLRDRGNLKNTIYQCNFFRNDITYLFLIILIEQKKMLFAFLRTNETRCQSNINGN